jgi:hypothetical protein
MEIAPKQLDKEESLSGIGMATHGCHPKTVKNSIFHRLIPATCYCYYYYYQITIVIWVAGAKVVVGPGTRDVTDTNVAPCTEPSVCVSSVCGSGTVGSCVTCACAQACGRPWDGDLRPPDTAWPGRPSSLAGYDFASCWCGVDLLYRSLDVNQICFREASTVWRPSSQAGCDVAGCWCGAVCCGDTFVTLVWLAWDWEGRRELFGSSEWLKTQ